MGCGDEKLSKCLTQTFTAHCNAMICQQVTLSGDAEWPKVADAVIEADFLIRPGSSVYRHAAMGYDAPSEKPCRGGASWWSRCNRSVPWPTCRWCWGSYASSTWRRSSIPAVLRTRLMCSRV